MYCTYIYNSSSLLDRLVYSIQIFSFLVLCILHNMPTGVTRKLVPNIRVYRSRVPHLTDYLTRLIVRSPSTFTLVGSPSSSALRTVNVLVS